MNTLITWEIVNLLVEKKFNVSPYLKINENNPKNLNSNYNPLKYQPWYIDLTIADVIMWIYKKYGIWIANNRCFEVTDVEQKGNDMGLIFNDKFNYTLTILEKNSTESSDCYNSPTEAYQNAIEYCLTNLI